MSGKIAVGGGIPKAILSRSSAALRAPLIFARSFLERVLRKFKTRLRRTMPMLSTFTTSESKRSSRLHTFCVMFSLPSVRAALSFS